jgi:hypothetical protein
VVFTDFLIARLNICRQAMCRLPTLCVGLRGAALGGARYCFRVLK